MVVSTKGDLKTLLLSLFIGAVIGAVFDVFRIIRIALFNSSAQNHNGKIYCLLSKVQRKRIFSSLSRGGPRRLQSRDVFEYVLVFALDIVFSLFVSACSIILIYTANMGRVRLYILLAEFFGFLLYHKTLGVVVIRFSSLIIALIDTALKLMYNISVYPILLLVFTLYRRLVGFFVAFVGGLIGFLYTKKRKSAYISLAKRGFDILTGEEKGRVT